MRDQEESPSFLLHLTVVLLALCIGMGAGLGTILGLWCSSTAGENLEQTLPAIVCATIGGLIGLLLFGRIFLTWRRRLSQLNGSAVPQTPRVERSAEGTQLPAPTGSRS